MNKTNAAIAITPTDSCQAAEDLPETFGSLKFSRQARNEAKIIDMAHVVRTPPRQPSMLQSNSPQVAAVTIPAAAGKKLPNAMRAGCCLFGSGAKCAKRKSEGKGTTEPRKHQTQCSPHHTMPRISTTVSSVGMRKGCASAPSGKAGFSCLSRAVSNNSRLPLETGYLWRTATGQNW